MIWHIFRKDFGQLWPIVALAGVAHFANATISILLGVFSEPAELRTAAFLLPYASMLAQLICVASVIHLEPMLGSEHDWRTRPISRGELLMAKAIFVLVCAHGPLLVADIFECLGSGFGVGVALLVALSNGLSRLLLLSAPAMCVAAVTRNISEMLLGTIALVLGCGLVMLVCAMAMGSGGLSGNALDTPLRGVGNTGVEWMRYAAIAVAFTCLASAALPLQYLKSRTSAARALVISGTAAFAVAWMFIPWNMAFALQRSLGTEGAAQVSAVAPPTRFANPMEVSRIGDGSAGSSVRLVLATEQITIPLVSSGLGSGARLLLDRAEYRLLDASDMLIFAGSRASTLRSFADADDWLQGPSHDFEESIGVPSSLHRDHGDEPLSIVVKNFMTMLVPGAPVLLKDVGGKAGVQGNVTCRTRYDAISSDLELRCLVAGNAPSCFDVSLYRNFNSEPETSRHYCSANYAPISVGITPTLIHRVGVRLPVTNAQGGVTVRVVPYSQHSHFQQTVVVRDWTSSSGSKP